MSQTKTCDPLPPFAPRESYSAIYPLDAFYAARRLPPPVLDQIEADQIPEPYRLLLVHDSDMTSRLEAFHKRKIHIRLLARRHQGEQYFREVVLELDGSLKPVEFGAVKINLDAFPSEAQEAILREQRPLGRILHDCAMTFSSRPGPWLRMKADGFIGGALGLAGTPALFGRRNTLLDGWERPLAEIVEILPP